MDKRTIIEQYFSDRLELGGQEQLPFVALSRQAGAGGSSFAETLIKVMAERSWNELFRSWKIFDRELCDLISDDPKLKVLVKSLLTEEYHSEIQEFLTSVFGGPAHQYELYKKTFELVRTLAAIGKVIIVGRGAVFATMDMPAGVRVRLIAPESVRVKRMAELLQIDKAKARDVVRSRDRQRSRMVFDFFNKDSNDPSSYDGVWDTSEQTMEEIAQEVLTLIEKKAGKKNTGKQGT